MTGKTSASTYALIEGPAPDDLSLQWTATIFRKGYKRTTVVRAYSEERVKEMCIARGVTEFVGRTGTAPSSSALPPDGTREVADLLITDVRVAKAQVKSIVDAIGPGAKKVAAAAGNMARGAVLAVLSVAAVTEECLGVDL